LIDLAKHGQQSFSQAPPQSHVVALGKLDGIVQALEFPKDGLSKQVQLTLRWVAVNIDCSQQL